MQRPSCPFCGSKNIEETDRFDMTYIEPEECGHDFACDDCEGLFQILYAPIEVRKVAGAKPGEVEAAEKMIRSQNGLEHANRIVIQFDPPAWSAEVYFTYYTGKVRTTARRETLMAEGDTPTEAAKKLIAEFEVFQRRQKS
jgi:hypothetical protein